MDVDNILTIDVETGGLDHLTQPLLSLAIHRPGAGGFTREWFVREADSVIRRAAPEAMRINGIDLEYVKRCGWPPAMVAAALKSALDAARDEYGRVFLVAHGARFDALWVERLFRLAGIPAPVDVVWVCSLSLAIGLNWARGRGPYSFSRLCERFQVENKAPHTAHGDAEALGRLLPHLIGELGGPRRTSKPENENQETLL